MKIPFSFALGTVISMAAVFALPCMAGAGPAAAQTAPDAAAPSYTLSGGVVRVPLEMIENEGVERKAWPASFGVPFPAGLVAEPSALRLLDAEGREVPCQFAALSRYWALDNSVRWVLLDFQADIPAGGRTTYVLTNDKPAAPVPDGVRVSESADAITVATGPLKVVVSRARCSLFESVSVGDAEVIRAAEHDGPRATTEAQSYERVWGPEWNLHGWENRRSQDQRPIKRADYFGDAAPPDEVAVERNGPLHAVVRVRGSYKPSGKGADVLEQGVYNFTYRLHFYRGKDYVRVEHSVENSRFESPQFMTKLLDHSLWSSLRLGKSPACAYAGADGAAEKAPAGGGKVVVAAGPKGREPWIEVSGDGKRVGVAAGQWLAAQSLEYDGGRLAVRPYSLSFGEAHPISTYTEKSWGADSFCLDFGSRVTYDYYYRFASGGESGKDLAALARGNRWPLFGFAPAAWYADCGVWNMELHPDNVQRGRRDPKADPGAAFDPYSPEGENTGRQGNWSFNSGGHHGNLSSLYSPALKNRDQRELQKCLKTTRTCIDFFQWNYRGHEPTNDAARLEHAHRMILFGPKDLYMWGKRGNNPGSSLLSYKYLPDFEHYGFLWLFEHYYLWGDARARESLMRFANFSVTFEWDVMFQREVEKGDWWNGRKETRSAAGTPGIPALDQTDFFDKHHGSLRRSHYARIYSWQLYTPLQAYQATGEPVYDLLTRWQLRRLSQLQRLSRGIPEAWVGRRWDNNAQKFWMDVPYPSDSDVTTYEYGAQQWMIGKTMLGFHEAYKTYGDEAILDNLWGEADYYLQVPWKGPGRGIPNAPTIPATLMGTNVPPPNWHMRTAQALGLCYYYTGDRELKKRFDDYLANARPIGATWGDLCAWVLAKKGGRDKPPEAVSDLACARAGRDGLAFNWTAPRAHGAAGKAARYFLKCSARPLVKWAPVNSPTPPADPWLDAKKHLYKPECWHPDFLKKDAFWMADHVEGEPVPGPAGTRETCTVKTVKPFRYFGLPPDRMPKVADLPAGKYYFALCSYDEDNNLSDLSNVVEVELK